VMWKLVRNHFNRIAHPTTVGGCPLVPTCTINV
jgi:hypothetical protein